MKYLVITALIGLTGLTCFVPAHLYAHSWENGEFMHPGPNDIDERYGNTLGFVYGRAVVWAHYAFPIATSVHSAYINNYSGGLPDWPNQINDLRFYVDFVSNIEGPEFEDDDEWNHEGNLDSYWSNHPDARPGYWWVDNIHLEYDLEDEDWGEYTLAAESKLTAKKDIDGNGIREIESWVAEAELENFDHREKPLGIDDWNWNGSD